MAHSYKHKHSKQRLNAYSGYPSAASVFPGSCFHGLPDKIRIMINEALPNAVTYRRRDFESSNMMRELASRSGVVLPRDVRFSAPVCREGNVCNVTIICNRATAGAMATHVETALRESGCVQLGVTLETADKVLLFLSPGILEEASSLALLRGAIADVQSRDHKPNVLLAAAPRVVCGGVGGGLQS